MKDQFEVVALTPYAPGDPDIAAAAARAGGVGVIDLEWMRSPADRDRAAVQTQWLCTRVPARAAIGVRLSPAHISTVDAILAMLDDRSAVVILTDSADVDLVARVRGGRGQHRVLVEVRSLDAYVALLESGVRIDGAIACGHEAGGFVGDDTTLVLIQKLLQHNERLTHGDRLPIYARGGIGCRAAAGCRAAGARGIVLDDQLLLTPESPLPEAWRQQLANLSGQETVVLGAQAAPGWDAPAAADDDARATTVGGASRRVRACRVLDRPAFASLARLKEAAATLDRDGDRDSAHAAWDDAVASTIGWGAPDTAVWPIGQAIGLAETLVRRYGTTERIVRAMLRESARLIDLAREIEPLAPGAPLARSHGTEFPIVQGPMTRVTDRAEFAAAVADAGGLPLLALAVLTGEQARPILEATAERLDARPWGVGVLGFVPPDLKQQQLAEIRRVRPPFALLAGGRPDEAAALEASGIPTYVHTPVPALLRRYLTQGVRRFVFEGRECGGHVGPLCSLPLWEAMIEVLLDHVRDEDAPQVHVLFAGGIHDARSSALVAAMAAPLAQRGIKCGVLMGTAYLFTHEAVRTGAILERYQREAIDCRDTVLLATGIGHANRVARTAFAIEFDERRRTLLREQRPATEVRDALESLTLGRLRLASKGLVRAGDGSLAEASDAEQTSGGTYMLGQIATVRSAVCAMRELHEDITLGAVRLIEAAAHDAAREPAAREAAGREAAARDTPGRAASSPSSARRRGAARETETGTGVAIIGFAALLPGATRPAQFWRRVLDQAHAITEIPPNRWDRRLVSGACEDPDDLIASTWGGFCPDIRFEPIAHRMPPAVMRHVCSHQLLTLEVARWALADAGYATRAFDRDRTAVIIGVAETGGWVGNKLIMRSMLPFLLDDVDERVRQRLPAWTGDSFTGMIGNVTAGRVSNQLDLGGPNFCVDAACASSLLALDIAVRELESGRSRLAIAGGVDTSQTPFSYAAFTKTQALSPTGRARVFDKSADGIVISEGVCLAVLKPLADARRDGDRVYAVIRGSGSSSDGRGLSLTAPKVEGQRRAIERALTNAGVTADTIALYEAHGTGTPLGDRTEVETLTHILTADGAAPQSCAVGSVKSLVGHTKAAAGIVGVMKAALALHHRVLPPHAGVEDPLDALVDPKAPVYLLNRPRPWFASGTHPRRANVSAFGFGGTNGSLVLEEADDLDAGTLGADRWPCELLLFAAPTTDALAARLQAVRVAIDEGAEPELSALALALARAFDAAPPGPRLAIVADDLHELRETLAIAERLVAGEPAAPRPNLVYVPQATGLADRGADAAAGPVAFLFPGQGSQYPAMALDQTLHFRELREAIEEANTTLRTDDDRALSDYVFPVAAFTDAQAAQQRRDLAATHRAQPAIGAISMGLLQVLDRLGVRPDAAAGHSYGELTALHAAGALTRSALLRLSHARGRAMARCCGDGGMVSVHASREATAAAIRGVEGVVVANHNGPDQTVISGSADGLAAAATRCASAGLRATPLPVAGPFHSPRMAPAAEAWQAALADVAIGAPRTPTYGNADGTPYPQDGDAARVRLGQHLLQSVEFVAQIERMHADGARIFVEVGPGGVLSRLTTAILGAKPHVCVATDPQNGRLRGFLTGLGQLAVHGVRMHASRLFDDRAIAALSLEKLDETKPAPPTRTTWWVDGAGARPHDPSAFAGEPAALITVEGRAEHRQVDRQPIGAPAASSLEPAVVSVAAGHHAAGHPPAAPEAAVHTTNGYSHSHSHGHAHHDMNGDNNFLLTAYTAYQETMREFLAVHERALANFFAMAQGTPISIAARPEPSLPAHVPMAPPSLAPLPVTNGAPANGHASNGASPDAPPPPIVLPASAPASASPPATTSASPALSSVPAASDGPVQAPDVEQVLRQALSAQTGYPIEMLGLDLDLASDLGVDSIRHVQMLHDVAEAMTPEQQQAISNAMEDLLHARTLRAIVDRLTRAFDRTEALPTPTATPTSSVDRRAEPQPLPPPTASDPHRAERREAQDDRDRDHRREPDARGAVCPRFVVHGVDAPLTAAYAPLAPGAVVITEDEIGVAPIVERLLDRQHVDVVVLTRDEAADPEALRACVRGVKAPIRAVLHLAALSRTPLPDRFDAWRRRGQIEAKALFQILSLSAERTSGRVDGLRVVAASLLGGSFGRADTPGPGSPLGGAAVGMLKCVELEWPRCQATAVDFAESRTPAQIADAIVAELLHPDTRTEIGYPDGRRTAFVSVEAPHGAGSRLTTRTAALEASGDWIVLATGGARGITAQAIEAIARPGMTVILTGRQAVPREEPAPIAGLSEADLRRHFIDQAAAGGGAPSTPATIDARIRGILRDREMRATFAALEAAGVHVVYRACDVRDPSALPELLDWIHRSYGRLDAVIHGAGVIEDSLIVHKDWASFDRVFDTKVDSAYLLARHLRAADLKLVVFFSSVAGRAGNAGQADYAAANEVMNRFAWQLAAQWPHVRVAAINWGPWASSGMATTRVRALLEARGILAIETAAGRAFLTREIAYGHARDVEVIAGEGPWRAATAADTPEVDADVAASPAVHHHAAG